MKVPTITQSTSHKMFSEGKQVYVGMEASKTNHTRWESMTLQHFHTIPASCAILPPLTQICYVFILMCMSYVMGCCNVVAILSMADMVCLDCMQKLYSA